MRSPYRRSMRQGNGRIIHGDALSVSIAAASIVAKVYRDQLMRDWDAIYPEYHLANNKGYYTREHMKALQEHGVSPLHRKNYLPVAQHSLFPIVLEQGPENLELFPDDGEVQAAAAPGFGSSG